MNLSEIMKKQAEFDKAHAGRSEWGEAVTVGNLQLLEHELVCLLGEIGEFANVVKKTIRGDLTYQDAKPQLVEELTDTFIYLIKLCNSLGMDLESAFSDRLNFNWQRFKQFEK